MVKRNEEISSSDPMAIEKLKFRLKEIENKRIYAREFNKVARKKGTKVYTSSHLEKLRNLAVYYNKRINQIEELRKRENKTYVVNDVKVIENYSESYLEFHILKPLFLKTILELRKNKFIWNENKLCWCRSLEEEVKKYVEIIK